VLTCGYGQVGHTRHAATPGSWFFLLLLPAACRLPFLNEKTKTRRSAMPLGGFVSTRKAYL
jgi:hypothetical protein